MRSGVLRHASLVLLIDALVILGANEVFLRTRGASSPEDMTSRYVTAMRRGDVAAVAWLMPDGRPDEAAIRGRVAMYRALPGDVALLTEATQHSEAAYIKGARIRFEDRVIDEIGMQHHGGRFGARWRLFFPPPGSLR